MDNFNQARTGALDARVAQDAQAQFIRKTYLHVALAVAAFIGVEALFLNTPAIVEIGLKMTQGFTWLLVLGGFMFVSHLANNWAKNSTSKNVQYAGLALYVVAQAFIFVPLLAIATYYSPDGSVISNAAIITLGLFTGLSAVVLVTRKNFSFLGRFLAIAFPVALAAIVAGIIFGFTLGWIFSVVMIVLAAASILYQTSNLVHEYNQDQYVAASLGLFASLMLMFWYVIQLLISLSGD